MKRPNCPDCQYPTNACLCASIRPLATSVELVVLQDPGEVKHAKNSVKLMKAVIPDLQVVVGETAEDFMVLKSYLDSQIKPIFVLYPSADSQSVSELSLPKDVILLLIDGTWRKVFKLLALNPWLNQYSAVHLDLNSPSNYIIRKAKRADSLSTLEAAAMGIKAIEPSCDVSPLTDALNALVEQRLNAMPLSVRQRYLR
ncbi:DTW domain-containing protein [Shewanella mesophila]|uniref:tRNA-uridine aminocarboxypropyltransferase n=1 Tax=Shewanella mesophila TaxID=2864208 RepID=UPI001C65CB82|nr:tRNA-uridine aminocarboxypropyltransferase [Shewanella mesophila]QYJ85971.1 DTW domain-containing protein [Shewanella mesophila]